MSDYETAELEYLTSASAADLWKQHYSDIPPEIFRNALWADPTFSKDGMDPTDQEISSRAFGKFTKRILVWMKQVDPNVVWFSEVRKMLEHYLAASKDLPVELRDINKFKTFDSFVETFQEMFDNEDAEAKRAKERAAAEAKVLAEDEHWIIIRPKTHFASAYYGKDSGWCTAKPDSAYWFNRYGNGKLYMLMNKDDKENSFQLYDPAGNNDPGDPDLRDFNDDTVKPSDLPSDLLGLLETVGVDPEKVMESTTEIKQLATSVWSNESEPDSNGFLQYYVAVQVEHYTQGGEVGDSDELGFATLRIGRFDYRQVPPELLVKFPDVNWAAPGLVIEFKSSDGYQSFEDMYNHALRSIDDDVETNGYDFDTYELKKDARKLLSGSEDREVFDKVRSPAFIVAFSNGGYSDNDDIISALELQGSAAPFDYDDTEIEYPGVDPSFSCVVFYVSEEGDLADALTNDAFRNYMNGEVPATTPLQRKMDRQMDLPLEGSGPGAIGESAQTLEGIPMVLTVYDASKNSASDALDSLTSDPRVRMSDPRRSGSLFQLNRDIKSWVDDGIKLLSFVTAFYYVKTQALAQGALLVAVFENPRNGSPEVRTAKFWGWAPPVGNDMRLYHAVEQKAIELTDKFLDRENS